MFAFKVATLLAVASVASAVPAPQAGSCSTGPVQCCDSIAPAGSQNSADLLGLIPVVLQGVNVPIGVNCISISVIGLGSSGTCSSQAACCSNVNNNGLVPIGLDCSPVNVGL